MRRAHPGIGNWLPKEAQRSAEVVDNQQAEIACRERLGGLLKHYDRKTTKWLTNFTPTIEYGLVVDTTAPKTIIQVKCRNPLLYWALQHLVPCRSSTACPSGEGTTSNRPLAGLSTDAKEVSHASVS